MNTFALNPGSIMDPLLLSVVTQFESEATF